MTKQIVRIFFISFLLVLSCKSNNDCKCSLTESSSNNDTVFSEDYKMLKAFAIDTTYFPKIETIDEDVYRFIETTNGNYFMEYQLIKRQDSFEFKLITHVAIPDSGFHKVTTSRITDLSIWNDFDSIITMTCFFSREADDKSFQDAIDAKYFIMEGKTSNTKCGNQNHQLLIQQAGDSYLTTIWKEINIIDSITFEEKTGYNSKHKI